MELTRRRLLAVGVGTAGVGALAGCLDGSASDGTGSGDGTASGSTTATSSFFVFSSIAGAVAGDATATDLLVPVGQHGHGWEPGPRVREEIYDADLLVHGPETFQPWIDDVLADLDGDGAEVTTVDVAHDVDLLPADGNHGHEGEHTGEHQGTDHHDDGHEETDHHDENRGTDHHDDEGHGETEPNHDEGHNHGSTDPHFWMDPARVATAVETVEAGFADVDPDNADAYAENAETFREELTDLDARIEGVVDDAATDTLLVAGHDSFGYLADHYGVHVEALTGISPDDRPTTRDIQHAQEVIDEHGLRYVCADPLESQQAAEQLVAETDAEAVLPLTAMPGRTDEWDEEGWGYVDVMTEVNVPTLSRALDA